jgi:ER membrane protein complex subunit 3
MTLLLDPDIRDWVVLPLFVIMVVTGLLRHAVSQWLQGAKTKAPVVLVRSQNVLRQTMRIRSTSHHYMTTHAWQARRAHVVQYLQQEAEWCEAYEKKEKGGEGSEGDGTAAGAADADDPMAALMNNPMSMMQGNMVFMVQNMVMMQGIQHFFSGFILLKIPFPLTVGFKSMFQRGLASLPDLEPSYVSSISWYFLVMYGLRSFFRLAIGDPSLEIRLQDQFLHQIGLQNANPNPGKKQDAATMAKQLRQEAENLELQVIAPSQRSELDSVERRLLGKRYPKKAFTKVVSSDSDFLLGGGSGGAKSSSKSSKRKTQ